MFTTIKQITEAYGKGIIDYATMWQEIEAITTKSSTCHNEKKPNCIQNDHFDEHPTSIFNRVTHCGQLVLN